MNCSSGRSLDAEWWNAIRRRPAGKASSSSEGQTPKQGVAVLCCESSLMWLATASAEHSCLIWIASTRTYFVEATPAAHQIISHLTLHRVTHHITSPSGISCHVISHCTTPQPFPNHLPDNVTHDLKTHSPQGRNCYGIATAASWYCHESAKPATIAMPQRCHGNPWHHSIIKSHHGNFASHRI